MWKRGNAWSLPVLIVRSASSLSLVNAHSSMIRKSGYRFCDKIMLPQKASELAKRLKTDHSEHRRSLLAAAPVIQNILRLPGDNSGTPPLDPIPNSTVKRSCADGTTSWESRSSPGMPRMLKSPFHSNPSPVNPTGLFLCPPSTQLQSSVPGRLL